MGKNNKITYNQFLHRISQNMDLSKKENKQGQNNFGVEFSDIRTLHAQCILAKNPKEVIEKLTHLSKTTDLNHYLNEYNMNLIFFTRNPQILEALINLGVDLSHKTNNKFQEYTDYATPGCCSLHYAARNLWFDTIQLLIKDENMNEIDDDGYSPWAYLKDNIEEEKCKIEKMERFLFSMTNKGAKIIKS